MSTIPQTDIIDSAQLQQLRRDNPHLRLIDVRTGGEYENVHIPGSYNIPLDTLAEHVADLADVDHEVVLICQSGGRASQAHQKLAAAGKHTLHILEGGMGAWQNAGGDVVRGESGKWAMDRQVRFAAGLMALLAVVLSLAVPGLQWVAAAVGAGLVFSAVTNTCAMAAVLAKLPYNRTEGCDIGRVLDDLNRKEA